MRLQHNYVLTTLTLGTTAQVVCMFEREKLVGELFVPGPVVSLLSLGHPLAGPGIGGCMFMYYLTLCVAMASY